MEIQIYNKQGKKTEKKLKLNKDIFEVSLNADLVHQVLVSAMSNRRQGTAHTKDRSEVRGGGRKPWRQKGTGRARHGSSRSPIWVGGGVTFGPRNEKNYKKVIPAKMKRKALRMVLSEKAKNNLLIVLEDLKIENAKTKLMAELIKKLPMNGKSRLVLHKDDKGVYLATRNIKKTGVLEAKNLNIVDLMNHKYLVLDKESIKEIETIFGDKSEIPNLKS